MKTAFILTVAPKGISGGRYHTLMLAELAAAAGHEVDIYADNRSEMFDLLKTCPAHQKIRYNLITIGENFEVKNEPDVCILAPDMSQKSFLYEQWLSFKERFNSSLVFINFETPNWFNELSPVKREFNLWALWDEYAIQSDIILSIAAEGAKYAKSYYNVDGNTPRFEYGYPAIQSQLIDDIKSQKKSQHFLTFARFNWAAHKGVSELANLMDSRFEGYTLKIVCGQNGPPENLKELYNKTAEKSGMKIDYLYCLGDREKFIEIKKSAAVLFPSFFEGFGYPPIEALCCGTPCVSFRLPVLEETCGSNITMVEPGNWTAFRDGMAKVIEQDYQLEKGAIERARSVSDFYCCRDRFDRTLRSLKKGPFNRLLSKIWK